MIQFKDEVTDGNVEAAAEFLSLTMPAAHARSIAHAFKSEELQEFYARDVLRAAGLEALPSERVTNQLFAMHEGDKLNPVLLVVDEQTGKVIVADGYHRLSAARLLSEKARVKAAVVYR